MVFRFDIRTPESVWEDRRLEAEVYHAMDHREVNSRFVLDLIAGGSVGPDVYDLGAGTGLIAVELCRNIGGIRVLAVDPEIEMLTLAKLEIDVAGLLDRVFLAQGDIRNLDDFAGESVDTIISNSVLHHLDHPREFFREPLRLLKPGGRLFVRDLIRPATFDQWNSLMNLYAADCSEEAKQMLGESLRASLTVQEIKDLATEFGIDANRAEQTSDRHWTLDWTKPEDLG
jgi:ubiquinone/menaquinone biosynthesis C-methylase UbiE